MDKLAILQKLDLSPSEARAYLAILDAGEVKVSEIGRLIGVTRMAGYTASELLVSKGLLSYIEKKHKRTVIAEDPDRLRLRLRERKNKILEEEIALDVLMPELRTLFSSGEVKPQVKVYSGKEGLKTAMEDILKTLKKGETYVGYGSVENEFIEYGEYFLDYVPRRVKRNISFRGVVPAKNDAISAEENKNKLRDLRYVDPKEFPFKNEINIYGNKISIISFKDQIGLIIESKQIADTQRLIFELAWRGAGIKN